MAGAAYFNMGDARGTAVQSDNKGCSVVTKTTGTDHQIRDGVNEAPTDSDFVFESGKTYRVDFGVYDLNSTDVRFILTVDGLGNPATMDNQYSHTVEGALRRADRADKRQSGARQRRGYKACNRQSD